MSEARKSKYDEKQARITERSYQSPEIVAQRVSTLRALALRAGESVLDIGVGPALLASDMARQVGEAGRVVGVDNAPAMIGIARDRCADLPQVEIVQGDAVRLGFAEAAFDAVACTQVLLYVADVGRALDEMHRVLKPGGRAVVVETDWSGLVLGSSFPETTEKMIQSWDAAASNPRLPPVLEPLLKASGFGAIAVTAVPVMCSHALPGGYAHSMLTSVGDSAVARKRVSASERALWFEDLMRKNEEGGFFFCVNRFVFRAVRL